MPVAVQPPEPSTIAFTGPVVCVPSVAVTNTVAPIEVVPDAVVLVTLPLNTGLVTLMTETNGGVVSFNADLVAWAELPAVSTAVAVKVTVPSFRVLTLIPVAVQLPIASTTAVTCGEVCVPSVA